MPPFKQFGKPVVPPPKPKRAHVLVTPQTCDCDKTAEDPRCPVCDWGLGVCSVCGGGEADLVGTECPGKKPKVKPQACVACEGMGRSSTNRPCTPCGGTGVQGGGKEKRRVKDDSAK